MWSRNPHTSACIKSSNSGDTLEHQVPSYAWKSISGWSNYSGRVKSLENPQKEVGYRGSKSVLNIANCAGTATINNNVLRVVKEQRLDGDCIGGDKLSMLRYSLMGLYRGRLFRILSKQISFMNTRGYSTNCTLNSKTITSNLNPWFITGLCDGECCFYVGIQKNNKSKYGWTVELIFTITLHKKDEDILEQIKNYFGVGYITKHGKNTLQYRVKSIRDLKFIVEHFEKYPLITQKLGDYYLFKMVFDLVIAKEHLKIEGLSKIVGIRATLNTGINENLKEAFPGLIPIERPVVEGRTVPDPWWFAGFASAESCFLVNIRNSSSNKCGYQVWLSFVLTQHKRDEKLMRSFENYLGCGSMEITTREVVNFHVRKLSDIMSIVIPFFQKHPIIGVKSKDFEDWCKVANLMLDERHLTLEGVEEIEKIKLGMNTKRESS